MTDRELKDFIEHGENGFVDFALTFGDGWAIHAIEIAKELRARLAQPDMQIGITYEEANPPEPYCKRCGKKLGTEAHDVHTCTPKEIQPVAWLTRDRIDGCWYATNKKESSNDKPLYTAPQKKEWVGLTDEEINLIWKKSPHIVGLYTYTDIAKQVEAKLKEKNETT